MQSIVNQEGLASILSHDRSVLYFYVDWSVYAVRGLQMVKELELAFSINKNGSVISFWLADVSNVDAPAAFLSEWLKAQERADLKMFNVVAAGSGSLAWLKQGKIVDFALSATHHKVDILAERTKNAFGGGAT